ncbi:unnamed protein product [Closterium sp. NIES-64]|nr:unnamed protein product [Closterium sp. NIES-64]
MAHGFTVTAVLAILLVCIPLSLANDPPSGQPSGLPQQSQAVPGSQLRNNATSPSSVDQQPSNQAPSRASPPLQAELFAHSPAESPPSLNDRQSASTANAPASQPSAEPPAQQLPQLSSPPQAPPAGSRTEPSSDARNNAPAAPAFPEAAPPLSPAGGETVSGAPAQEKGGAEASREEAEQLSTTCGLTDYIRQSGACDSKGRRTVSFVKARNCTDPFPVQPSQQEPCTCTPEDFDVVYTASRDGATCNMQYLPRNCTGAQQSQLIPVDKVYCGLPNAPCTEAHVDAIYSDCDFIRDSLTGLNISAMRFVEVRPGGGAPWGRCTLGEVRPGGGAPWGRCTLGEVHPGGGAPWGRCTLGEVHPGGDMQCGAGHYLHHDHCHKCPAGTYSMGGKWRFQDISEIDPLYFKVYQRLWHLPLRPVRCPSALTAPHHPCCPCAPTPPMPPYILSSAPPWYADDGAFEAGAYDYINDWLPEVCASNPAYNCHNNLLSSLSLDVHLVRDGYVRYVKFNFTVSAEVGHDGLAFYIDSLSQPLMALTSYQASSVWLTPLAHPIPLTVRACAPLCMARCVAGRQFEPREMVFPVEAGQHRLVWVYSKDDKWSKGEDIATIPYIEVDGVAFNDFLCTPCPAGFYSAEGAGACEPCPENTISNVSDSTITYTPCQLASKKRIMKWQWIQPQICDPSNITLPMDMPLDCEPCPDGQQAEPDPQSGEIRCTLCPPASYEGGAGSAGSMLEGRCETCSEGQVAMKTLSLRHFTMQPNGALPPNFTTGCHGDCGTFGWRAFQDHLDSGSGHGPTASIWLALEVHMAVLGYMTFNYSVDILPGDPGRAFFFFIDHDLMDYVEVTSWTMWSKQGVPMVPFLSSHCSGRTTMTRSYSSLLPTARSLCQQQRVEWEEGGEESGHPGSGEKETRMSGIWELDVGRHSLMWVWQKLDDTGAATRTTRDSAVIYDIHIEGVAEGGAARCEEVPQGTTLAEGGDSYVPCPPGTSSEGGASSCLPCPPNTFNNQPQWACNPCGAGTSALAGSTECFIGDATRPASFCTFELPTDQLPRIPHLSEKAADEQAGQEGEGVVEGEEEGKGKRGMEGEAGEGGALPPGGTVGAVRSNEMAAAVVFDLSPLSRMHPGRMFGPVLDAAAAADPDGDAAGGEEVAEGGAAGGGGQGGRASKRGGGEAAEYFVSVCDRDSGNDTAAPDSLPHCITSPPPLLSILLSILPISPTLSSPPSNTPAAHPITPPPFAPCRIPTAPHPMQVDPREATSGARPGHNLGSAVAVYPLAAVHAGLYRRGLVMAFTGDECPQTNMPRETNLTFICDPAAGHGQPEAWTKEGQMAALNPVLGYPQYSQRGGAVQRIEHSDCSFSLVWYSLFACPLCSHEDYERVETAECMDETRATFKWKLPRVCQLNPFNPLPQDEPCEPCKPDDIIRSQGDCADANGNHNITYSWRQPHHCSPTLPGAASLPAPELVGPCEQRWVYVPSEALSPMWIALFVGLTVLIVGFGYLSLVTWLRSRRLRQMYQRLVEAEVQMEGDMVLRAAAFGGPAGRKTGMGVGDALVIQTALSVTLASAARRAGWISYHPERIGNENVRKAVDVALWVGDGITALGCAVIDAVKKMAGRGGNRLGRR